jgi:putative transposase
MLKVVENGAGREGAFRAGPDRAGSSAVDADGGVETEAADYVERYRHERDDEGRALVVHNGRSEGRKLTLGAGRVELRAPRVNDRRRDEQGQRQRFTQPHRAARHAAFGQGGRGASHPLSAICAGSPLSARALHGRFPPCARRVAGRGRGRSVADQHHPTYPCWERIHGVSPGRSRGARVRLRVGRWGAPQPPARRRPALHPGDDRRAAQRREGAASGRGRLPGERRDWKALLRNLERCGMAAPALAVGDGALGFWAALREVWPPELPRFGGRWWACG